MEDEINWTLDELVTRYEMHPDFCDLFVEGYSDQGFVSWFLEERGRKRISVYPVCAVSIPPDVVLGRGLPHPSMRGKAIALALELEARCPPALRATVIADLDFDRIEGTHVSGSLLLYTDYTSMEMYAFDAAVVSKLLKIVAPRGSITGGQLLRDITEPLQSMFALRLANHELGFGLTWLGHEKCTTLATGKVRFDCKEYTARYLNTKGKRAQAQAFNDRVNDVRRRFLPDARLQIRGHDFIEVLTWYLRKSFRSCQKLTPDAVRGLLLVQLTTAHLEPHGLFTALLDRIADC